VQPQPLQVALVGDRYNHDEPSYPCIEALLPALGVELTWFPTPELTDAEVLRRFDARACLIAPSRPSVTT
jgi:hypothetical protein